MLKTGFILLLMLMAAGNIFSQTARIRDLEKKLEQVNDTAKVNVLLELATEFEYINHQKAWEYAQQARDLAGKINFLQGIIRSQYELGIISMLKGERPEALSFLEVGLEYAGDLKDELYLASGYLLLSYYYDEEGDYPKALDLLHQALSIYEARVNQLKISQCYTSFGGIYESLGQYEQALNYYFESLRIKESVDDRRGISIVCSNIGGVYLATSRWKDARDYFLKALAIDRANHDQEGIVYNLRQLGAVNQKSSEYTDALSYFDSALSISRDLNFRIDESVLLSSIGSTLKSQKRLDESLTYLHNALSLKMELKLYGSAAFTCNDICETYLEMGKPAEAKKYALQAIELAKDVEVNQHSEGLYLLAKCEYALNDFKNAYDHLIQAKVISDSLFTMESEVRMHEMEAKYQSEQKEKEILTLTREKEAAEFRRNTYIFAGLSVSLLLFLLYNQQRIRSRKNRLLLDKEKELDRMKSNFFANITHEFRTPLTLILGPIEMMKSAAKNPKIHQQLNVMEMNASRLLDLINQLLDLSKLESGTLKLKVAQGNIVPVVKGIVMSFESIVQIKNIDLTVHSSAEEINIYYDREKIEKVLINLLSNAIKFTPDRGTIAVELNSTEQFLEILIRDSGRGIPTADRERIFNRFYQSENSDESTGTGIGLALAKELVELHHGSIEVRSEIGEGTEFIIHLPLGGAHLKNAEKAGDDELNILSPALLENNHRGEDGIIQKTSMADPDPANKPLLLLIEDNFDVRNYVVEILESDYQLLVATDGEEGIQLAMEKIPDIIISDVMMPGMDGYEVCAIIKQNEKTSHIPIILLTAKITSEDKIQGLENQADDYVTKPFVPRELLVRIQNLIDSRKKLRERFQRELILKPSEVAVNSVEEQFINKLLKIVEDNIGNEKFGVEQLSFQIGMSRSQIHRKLIALTNQAPNQFIRTFRLTRAMELLKKQAATASEIAFQVGFSSPSYFTKCFREQYGQTPSEVLEGSPEAS